MLVGVAFGPDMVPSAIPCLPNAAPLRTHPSTVRLPLTAIPIHPTTPMLQRLILEDDTTTYDVLVESTPGSPIIPPDDYERYTPDVTRGGTPKGIQPTIPPEVRVKLADVHKTIRGYTQYAIGAFKDLAIAEVEEINLKFNLKISAEAGLPMIASGKTESDFAIEVKCKFPKTDDTQKNV